MQHLKNGSSLQGGKYKIEKVLGQGGFGITYLAIQELLDRKVCIKEFFFKEYCERDEATSHITLGTQSSREMIERFMSKFLKEARTISKLEHPHIIRIYDIFQENNTAYYVMDFIDGENLSEIIKRKGTLPETEAVGYIKQVASALDYIHQRSINHLDIKPANIMVSHLDNKAILIDFGLSKQYDAQGGQTSTTPVGISHGYAPMEQYKQGGVSVFSPQTDIYSLGATLYKMVTGYTPPEPMELVDGGLTGLSQRLSSELITTIKKSMQPKRSERPQNISEFCALLNGQHPSNVSILSAPIDNEESTKVIETQYSESITSSSPTIKVNENPKKNGGRSKWGGLKFWIGVCTLFLIGGVLYNTINTPNHYEYVDLGLSVKWATCNLGASQPHEYGDYYAWGETSPKSFFSEVNSETLNKPEMNDIAGNLTYDAARFKWRRDWRLPTRDECRELLERCMWKWTTQNGRCGYKVEGPNGNSIFLPAAGWYSNSDCNQISECGLFWTSTPGTNNKKGAYGLSVTPNQRIVSWLNRYGGCSIRPVKE